MVDVQPFRGLRYDRRRVDDPSRVIAPPYDVISPEEQKALYHHSPYNVIRLEYGEAHPDDTPQDNRYTRAATALACWQAEGVLVRDSSPLFYVYDQEFVYAGRGYRRRSLMARVRLAPWEEGVIRPHEHTLALAKEDRLRLLRACHTNISPVFALYRDAQGQVADALTSAGLGEPIIDFTDQQGWRHVLRPLPSQGNYDALVKAFASEVLYVADGHHRYETALAYLQERQATTPEWRGDEPENFVMMALTAAHDPGLLILPIHRLVRPAPPPDFLDSLSRWFAVEAISAEADGLHRLLKRMAAGRDRGAPCFGLIVHGQQGFYLLTLRDTAAVVALMPQNAPAAWKRLDANALQYTIFQDILGIDLGAIKGGDRVDFTEDAYEARKRVQAGEFALAFLVNPVAAEQIFAVADAGWRMPQKSTFFYPKLPTGLIMNPLED